MALQMTYNSPLLSVSGGGGEGDAMCLRNACVKEKEEDRL